MCAVKKIGLILFSLILCCVFQWPVMAAEISEKQIIESKILGEQRSYQVVLPASYNDQTIAPSRYPVLYIVDGEAHIYSASGVIFHMSRSLQIPELIVVAVSNATNRLRDLTPNKALTDWEGIHRDRYKVSGGGTRFLAFIEAELIPKIDGAYRTSPHRTLAGHSIGGLFTLHAFLKKSHLFQSYIAIESSLWWDDGIMNQWLAEFLASKPQVQARLYLSLAEHSLVGRFDSSNMLLNNMRFAEQLQKSGVAGIQAKLQSFPGEDHGSVPLISFYYGLLHGFNGYKPSEDTENAGAQAISAHFKAFSEQVGLTFLPPEAYINRVVWQEEYLGRSETIADLLKLNTSNYPTSSNAHSLLADYYKKTEQPDLARWHDKKALMLRTEIGKEK